MGNDQHWATGLTTLEIAEQVKAMFLHDMDHVRAYADHDLLEALQVFTDKCLELRRNPDMITCQVLNQYVVPFWNNITIKLMPTHIELIHTYVDDWICQEQERSDGLT